MPLEPRLKPAVAAVPEEGMRVVGGAATSGIAGGEVKEGVKKQHGERGRDNKKRKKRTCLRCGKYLDCQKKHGEGKCPKATEQ